MYCILWDLAVQDFGTPTPDTRLSGTFLSFDLDGQLSGSYSAPWNNTRVTSYTYNQMVYENLGLADGTHTFMMNLNPDSVVLFDYAVAYQEAVLVTASGTSAAPSPTESDTTDGTGSPGNS